MLAAIQTELVGAGFRDEVHLYAGHAAVLCTVRVEDHGGFGDLVGPERVVAGPGFVVVIVRLGNVGSVHGIETRIEGQSVGVEVVVAASHVEPQSRGGEGEVGDVAAVHRQIGQLPCSVGGGLIGVLRLQQTGIRLDFDTLPGALDAQHEIDGASLSNQQGKRERVRFQARRLHCNRIVSGLQERETVPAGLIGHGRAGFMGCAVGDGNRDRGYDGATGIGHQAGSGSGGEGLAVNQRRGSQEQRQETATGWIASVVHRTSLPFQ